MIECLRAPVDTRDIRLKVVLLALALGAVSAAGAAADRGPGPGGGHPAPPPGGKPSGPPPPGGQQPGKASPGEAEIEDGERPSSGSERAFREQLAALKYACARKPVTVRGSLIVIGTDSVTIHTLRAAERGRPAAAVDIVAKVIPATQIKRTGHAGPATLADLVVTDAVEVQAAVCRDAGSAAGTPPTLVARQLGARAARV